MQDVSRRTRPSRSLSSETLLKLLQSGISLMLVSMKVCTVEKIRWIFER